MIIRIWHGYTTKENANAYEALLKEEVFKGIAEKEIKGYKGIKLLKRELEDEYEFITMMQFENMDSVKAFMGEKYDTAYVPAEAREILTHYDKTSSHYEMIHALSY